MLQLIQCIRIIDYFALYYFLAINTFYAILIFTSFVALVKRFQNVKREKYEKLMRSESLPGISIIVPCYNEDSIILDSIHSLLSLSYPVKQVIIVNDGSTDKTMQKLTETFDLVELPHIFPDTLSTQPVKQVFHSRSQTDLFVIDKERGGKGDALNAGINCSITPLYLAVDADTLIEKDALLRMIRPFLEDPSIVAEGATIRLVNGSSFQFGKLDHFDMPKTMVESVQSVEYLRAFLFGRLGWNLLGGNVIVSGAFGLFDREAVLRCGGYNPNSVAEDIELTLDLTKRMRHTHKKNTTHFIPDPIAWTVGPRRWSTLGNQRIRWHKALIDTLYTHRNLIGNPKYGLTGLVALPYQLFGELLHPFIEVIAMVAIILGFSLGVIDSSFLILFLLATWGITLMMTLFAIGMEMVTFSSIKGIKPMLKVIRAAFFEHLGYRQCYIFWKIYAFYEWFTKPINWTRNRI